MIKSKANILQKYFPQLSDSQLDLFAQAERLYIEWNSKINVVSRKDIDQLMVRHILHGLAISKIIQFKPKAQVLDVGTGGGFPGIPLAIMFPETHFHLVDSIGKKITVVKEIAKTLQLNNVTAEQIRAEKIKDKYDFVVSRAVAKLGNIIPWVRNNIKKESMHKISNGLITLKGGDLDEEIKAIQYPTTILDLNTLFEEEFFETKKITYTRIKA